MRLQDRTRSMVVRCRGRAFTLLELLVVIAISAILLAIILPSLSAAKETGHIATCLSNLRQIGASAAMYMDDEGQFVQPWHMGFDHEGGDIETVTEYIYGGFQVEERHPVYGTRVDVRKIHTVSRPYNKYIAPGFCQGPVKTYMCPSDTFSATAQVDDPCGPPVVDPTFNSWEVNGNSYAMNWNWLEAAPWYSKRDFFGNLEVMTSAGREMLRMKIGAPASKFVLFMESPMNAYIVNARPRNGTQGQACMSDLGVGWHKRFSRYSMAFVDGHAEHRFIDTRFTDDNVFNMWPEPNTQRGF